MSTERDAAAEGLLLPGGGDILATPLRWEEYQFIARFAEARRPILGICRGMQALNVSFGGTLYDRVPGHQIPGEDLASLPVPWGLLAQLRPHRPPLPAAATIRPSAEGRELTVCQWSTDGIPARISHITACRGGAYHPERGRASRWPDGRTGRRCFVGCGAVPKAAGQVLTFTASHPIMEKIDKRGISPWKRYGRSCARRRHRFLREALLHRRHGRVAQGLFCTLLVDTILTQHRPAVPRPGFLNAVIVTIGKGDGAVNYTIGGLAGLMEAPATAVAIGSACSPPWCLLPGPGGHATNVWRETSPGGAGHRHHRRSKGRQPRTKVDIL